MSAKAVRPVPDIEDAEVAFSTTKYLPAWEDIPEDFRQGGGHNANPYCRAVNKWFFEGLDTSALKPRKGVDELKAIRVLKAHLGSWQPKHEHKTAGVAYMMSWWFKEPRV